MSERIFLSLPNTPAMSALKLARGVSRTAIVGRGSRSHPAAWASPLLHETRTWRG